MLHMLIYTTVSENCMPISNPQLHSQSKKTLEDRKRSRLQRLIIFICLLVLSTRQPYPFVPMANRRLYGQNGHMLPSLYKSVDVGQAF